ncbi:MAG TPA: carboxypeptidase regulatory-like domain-containing protein [Candidatus Dormibacteraeota bacterium]|nr:carboxypeptidase regulatory-like domain-containing protein [Candidatus Dormibacteraeota bacterium]
MRCGANQVESRLFLGLCSSSLAFLTLAILLAAPFASAQSTGGRIRGTVSDQTGASVAAANLTLINDATHSTREVQSGADGEYIFIEVPVGTYELGVMQTGFKKFVRKDIVLNLNEVVSVDIALQLGGATETIEVTGAPPVIDTSSTQLGAVVNERSSTQLPLNQRDVYQLLQLQPGVQSQLGNDLYYGSDKAGVVTVNGGRGRSNNYTVNGGDGNDLFVNLPAIEPSPDSIEEFRVISNSFDAEYGRNSGAVVNVVTKSGTNSLHGSVYEFFRNDVINTHPFTFVASPKPAFKQNQFGGTIGGPIKKDKTFFFGSYEGRRIVQGIVSQQVTVPTATELGGDFSGGAAFTGSLIDGTVANVLQSRCGSGAPASLPANQKLTPAAQAQVTNVINGTPEPYSTIFINNQIPTGCFDPVALYIAQNYVPGAGGSASQVLTVPNKRNRGDQFQIKIDHTLSKNQKIAVYYYFDDDYLFDPFAKFQAQGAPLGNFPGVYATRTQQINVSHSWTIGSSAVNEMRFSYFREGQMKFDTPARVNAIQDSCGNGAAKNFCFTGNSDTPLIPNGSTTPLVNNKDFGIHSGLGPTKEGVPFIQILGGFSTGNNFGGQLPQTGGTFQFSDNYSKIIGNHSFKFGGDVRNQRFDQLLYFDINGQIIFSSNSNICGPANPNLPPNCTAPTGNDLGFQNAYPNYLLGLPNSMAQGSAQHELVRSKSVYLFAQDSWKIKPNLTLNYGVRWEMNTPLADIGQKVQTFRPGQRSTIYPCALDPTNPLLTQFPQPGVAGCDAAGVTPIGLVFPGDKGVPNGLTNTYYKAFAPRLGLNWSPGWKDGWLSKLTGGPSKTSVSMGFGIFYNPIEQLVLEQFSAEPPFGGSNFVPTPFLQTPYVGQNGTVFPNPFTGILNPPRNQPLDWSRFLGSVYFGQFPANMRPQYSDQYNLTIKRELPGNILLQVGYVGSQGHRLLATYEVNPGNPTTCLDLATFGQGCGPFGEDAPYSFSLRAGQLFHLPYVGGGPNGQNIPCSILNPAPACIVTGATGGTQITLVGIRPYSSPLCDPLSGTGCPTGGKPVFSGIFSEDTIAHSNYNSLQALFEKRFSHGLQFQASYTFSKSLDNASSFESALNPLNFNSTYGLSAFDSRHRFVFNYVWDLPIPRYDGFKGQLLDGWEVSGILTFQSGFPIRITSQADIELLDTTFDFEAPGQPNLAGPFKRVDPRSTVCAAFTGPLAGAGAPPCASISGFVFDPNLFTNATVPAGTIGKAPRSICCGPGINSTDMSFSKRTNFGERLQMEFRGDIFNVWNHAQFYTVDGNISNQGGTFGQVLHIRDPRLLQFALKFRF